MTFEDVLPDIAIDKSANPTSVSELGGFVEFTIVVTNNSAEAATIDSLVDSDFDLSTQCADAVGTVLAAGATYTCVFTEFLTGDDLVTHVNTATVVASDNDGNADEASDDATVTFEDVLPDIAIDKSANPTSVSELGGFVEFTIVVTNNSAEAATIDSLVDSDFDLSTQCADAVGTVLAAGATYTCVFTEFLTGDDLVTHVNTATVVASDNDGNADEASDDATVTFEDVLPDIAIDKSANPTSVSELGGFVEFTIVVTNNSAEAATIDSLVDSDFDLSTQCADAVGTVLAAGATYTCVFTEFLTGDDLVTHVNTATVVASDNDGNADEASDDATVTFEDVLPDIAIDKSANPTSVSELGGFVEFTIVVTNNSAEAATIDSLVDSDFDLSTQCADAVGTVLAAGATYTCVFTEFLTGDDLVTHVNTATVVASDNDGNADEASDDATVTFEDVLPDIAIDKSANPTSVSELGGFVEFTIVVTNNSAEAATIDSLVDSDFDLSTQCADAVGTVLAAGATYTCVFTEFLTGDDLVTHVNTATVVASDNDGNADEASDDATVTFEDVLPDIAIDKSANPTSVSELGGFVEFTIVVTNNSAEAATIDSLVDSDFDLSTQCADAVGTVLAAGATYTCVFTEFILGNVGDDHVNTATVVASDNDGNTDEASDDATVAILDVPPEIEVTKDANRDTVAPSGGYVEFTVTVDNNSVATDPVTITSIVDSVFGNILDLANPLVEETTCTEATIQPDETYTCTFTAFVGPGEAGTDHENRVTVVAVDDDGTTDEDDDDETILFAEGPGVGTPGFWYNHPSVWDGVEGHEYTEQDGTARPYFPADPITGVPVDVLYPVDSDNDGVPDTIEGVLIGDWNFNGVCDPWEQDAGGCIFFTLEEARVLINANAVPSSDKRFTLGRALLASWLNVIAGNDFSCIEDSINDGIYWLKVKDGDVLDPGDNNDGNFFDVADGELDGKRHNAWKGKTWTRDGEPVYEALDYYNNTGAGCAIDRDTGTRLP